MKIAKKTPEGKLVLHPNWQGNTVTNDKVLLQTKGVKSPIKNDMYAFAQHPKSKMEKWFRTSEKLEIFKANTENIHEYKIKLLP